VADEDLSSHKHTKCCRTVSHIEDVGRRAYTMVGGLEKLLLGMEPRTPSETLSLALVLAEELECFHANNISGNDPIVHAEKRRLEGALKAVIRGLIYGAGATSPLVDKYADRDELVP
jgi:hypothetical protein